MSVCPVTVKLDVGVGIIFVKNDCKQSCMIKPKVLTKRTVCTVSTKRCIMFPTDSCSPREATFKSNGKGCHTPTRDQNHI